MGCALTPSSSLQSLSPQDRAAYKEYISNVSERRAVEGGEGSLQELELNAPPLPVPMLSGRNVRT